MPKDSKTPAKANPADARVGPVLPLKPRPRLMMVFGILLLSLLVGLLYLYATTVYPHRSNPHPIEFETSEPATLPVPR